MTHRRGEGGRSVRVGAPGPREPAVGPETKGGKRRRRLAEPAVVDAWVRVVMKDGAASDKFGETQSLVNRTEERL